MPLIFTFDVDLFRVLFPAFESPVTFPDARLQMNWDTAITMMSDVNYGALRDGSRFSGLNLFTAHLTQLSVVVASGDVPLIETSATVDKVSVTTLPPPVKNQFSWWLSTTPYGMQLLALLSIWGVGGFVFGALPERSAIRNVASIFPGSR